MADEDERPAGVAARWHGDARVERAARALRLSQCPGGGDRLGPPQPRDRRSVARKIESDTELNNQDMRDPYRPRQVGHVLGAVAPFATTRRARVASPRVRHSPRPWREPLCPWPLTPSRRERGPFRILALARGSRWSNVRAVMCASSARSAHSQTIATRQPPSSSSCRVRRSRSSLARNLVCQNSRRVEGSVVRGQPGWRCQKQPLTKQAGPEARKDEVGCAGEGSELEGDT